MPVSVRQPRRANLSGICGHDPCSLARMIVEFDRAVAFNSALGALVVESAESAAWVANLVSGSLGRSPFIHANMMARLSQVSSKAPLPDPVKCTPAMKGALISAARLTHGRRKPVDIKQPARSPWQAGLAFALMSFAVRFD